MPCIRFVVPFDYYSGILFDYYLQSWTKVTNRIGFLDNECSILETRLQVKF